MRRATYFLPLIISAFLETSAVGEIVPPGHRPTPHSAHALINARIVVSPGQIITNGVVVIRRDRIEAVGAGLPIPSDARVWNMAGMTLYAGLIEPYLVQGGSGTPVNTTQFMPIAEGRELAGGSGPGFFGVAGGERDPGSPGVGHELSSITPERRMAAQFMPDAKVAEELRELGFTAACVAPDKGILRGQSVMVSLSEAPPNDLVLRADSSSRK